MVYERFRGRIQAVPDIATDVIIIAHINDKVVLVSFLVTLDELRKLLMLDEITSRVKQAYVHNRLTYIATHILVRGRKI